MGYCIKLSVAVGLAALLHGAIAASQTVTQNEPHIVVGGQRFLLNKVQVTKVMKKNMKTDWSAKLKAMKEHADLWNGPVSWRNLMSEIQNQGTRGACNAFAAVGLMEFNTDANYRYSEQCMVKFSSSQDSGQIENRMAWVASNGGDWSAADCPYDENSGDEIPSDINSKSKLPMQGSYTLYPQMNDDALDHLKSALDGGSVVGISVMVVRNTNGGIQWGAFGSKAVIEIPDDSEKQPCDNGVCGGHALVAIGYDDNSGLIEVRNSWGTGWGEDGYGYMTYNYFLTYRLQTNFVIWTHADNSPAPQPDPGPQPQPGKADYCKASNKDGLTCSYLSLQEGQNACQWNQSWTCSNGCLKWLSSSCPQPAPQPLPDPMKADYCKASNKDGLTCNALSLQEGQNACRWNSSWTCTNGCLKWLYSGCAPAPTPSPWPTPAPTPSPWPTPAPKALVDSCSATGGGNMVFNYQNSNAFRVSYTGADYNGKYGTYQGNGDYNWSNNTFTMSFNTGNRLSCWLTGGVHGANQSSNFSCQVIIGYAKGKTTSLNCWSRN